MKRGKPIILLMTILFAAVAVVLGRNEIGARNFPFSVTVTSDGAEEEIRCLKLEGEYYMFLPGYAEADQVRIRVNPVYDVFIDGRQLEQDQSCADFPVNTKLELYFRSLKNEGYETVTFVRSANVAAMYIDVPSGSMEYIHAKKGNAEGAAVRLYTIGGQQSYSGEAESINGRGNATWEAEKKSYSLCLAGEANLLDMGCAQRWILLANAYDLSQIRNKVVYDTAIKAGLPFSPETNWVDLYLNGEYAGLYLLSERNEVHPQRVAIPKENGFLVSLEFPYRLIEQNYPHVTTEKGLALRIHHSSVTQQELQHLWQSAENAILAENGIDPVSGKSWEELIDLESWAHKYLLEELFGNFDAGSVSQYFYCNLSEPEPKICAGPVWDFDNSLGRGGWTASNPCSFLANRAHFFSWEDAPLFHALYQKEAFYNRVTELFVTVYEPLLTELAEDGIRDLDRGITGAKAADQIRWYPGEPQETEKIRLFLKDRLAFFRDLWVNGTEYCEVLLTVDGSSWGCYLVPKGSCLQKMPDTDVSLWYDAATGEPFDMQTPIWEDMCLCGQVS